MPTQLLPTFTYDRLTAAQGDAMGRFLLTRIAGMSRERMIECLAVDVLGVRRQMALNRFRQVMIATVGHVPP